MNDLAAAGTSVIQVDEPALRETLPPRAADRAAYLEWATGAFRLTTGGVRPDTQVHTHMGYAEFGDVVRTIDDLDADVISLEAARSHMQVARELAAHGYPREAGPRVWDVHNPACEHGRGDRPAARGTRSHSGGAAVGQPGLRSEDPRLARDPRLAGAPGRGRAHRPRGAGRVLTAPVREGAAARPPDRRRFSARSSARCRTAPR